jgi:hypothetical protein
MRRAGAEHHQELVAASPPGCSQSNGLTLRVTLKPSPALGGDPDTGFFPIAEALIDTFHGGWAVVEQTSRDGLLGDESPAPPGLSVPPSCPFSRLRVTARLTLGACTSDHDTDHGSALLHASGTAGPVGSHACSQEPDLPHPPARATAVRWNSQPQLR